MHFEIIGTIENIETIAVGGRIREIMRLRRQYGTVLEDGGNLKELPASVLSMVTSEKRRFIGMRLMGLAKKR